MFKLFTDKSEMFEAKLNINGASYTDTMCRLVIETSTYNLLFNGSVDSNGNCEIPIKKLKQVYKEGDTGNIRLEIIADDTYFVPWESDFIVEATKRVVAEVKNKATYKTSVTAKLKSGENLELKAATYIVNELKSKRITLDTLTENKDILMQAIARYTENIERIDEVKTYVLKLLKKLL